MDNPSGFLQLLDTYGIVGLLVLNLFAIVVILHWGIKRKWVWGWAYEEKAQECEQWKALALQGTHLAEESTSLAQSARVIAQFLEAQVPLPPSTPTPRTPRAPRRKT